MASPEPLAPRVSASDVLGFTDAELIEFMQQSRRPGDGGGFDLDVDGWHTLEGDQKEKFAERLRFGAQKALESTPSRPVDLDQVTARLLEAAAAAAATTTTHTGRGYRPWTGESTASPPGLPAEQELQRQYHDMLVNDGGRPCYPIALVQAFSEAFSENIDTYAGSAEPWLSIGWEVFDIQLDHWHRFLQWQLINRGSYDPDAEYARYCSKEKLGWAFNNDPEAEDLEDNPLHLMKYWKESEARYSRNWGPLSRGDNLPHRLEGQSAFSAYVERVKCRLAQHGFTRTFQLEEDVKQQDKLSTWIEYLAYQYSWCDRYARQLRRQQPKFDQEWEKLVALGVLHDWETAEYLGTEASGFERQDQSNKAYQPVDDAKSAVKALLAEIEKFKQDPNDPRLQELERSLAEAKSKENTARQAAEAVTARLEPIRAYNQKVKGYRSTQREIQKQGELAQWILDQVPLVEAELGGDRNLESGPSPPAAAAPVSRPAAHQTPSPQPAHDAVRKTRSGRVTKRKGLRRKDARHRRSESAHAEVSPPPAPSPAPAPVSRPAAHQTPSPQSAHDAERKTRSGRVTKKTTLRRTDARPRRSESAHAGASPPPGPRPRRRNPESSTGAGSAVQPRKRRRKVYEKERASRRLAGQSPEFGMLPNRGEPGPLVVAPPQDSPRSATTRGKRWSQAQAGSGAKPRGVSKFRTWSFLDEVRLPVA